MQRFPPMGGFVQTVVLAFLIGVGVFATGIGIDWLVLPHRREVLVSDIYTGLMGSVLAFAALTHYQGHQRVLRARLETMAEVNHHVRNALTQVVYSVELSRDTRLIATTRQAVERIDWALREVLPRDN